MASGRVTKDRKQFNWSDAWLMLAISFASARGPATIEAIVAAGDSINFAVFEADELESGLVRLTEAGYVQEESDSFKPTKRVNSFSKVFLAKRRAMNKRLKDVEEMLGAHSALDEQPCPNDLRYPGFSKEKYEEAVRRYQGGLT